MKVLISSVLTKMTDGAAEMEIEAANVRQLFKQLEDRYPALKHHLDLEIAVAIDGEVYQDALLQKIGPDGTVHISPRSRADNPSIPPPSQASREVSP